MPLCSYPECEAYAIKGNVRCSAHVIRNANDQKLENATLKKQREENEKAEREKRDKEERDNKAQKNSLAQDRANSARAAVIQTHRQTWNAQIDHVVSQVMALRVTHPNANAGNNPGGNTQGGTDSPLTLATSGPLHGLSKGDILKGMSGLDSSDSGLFKFRRKQVLVHCK